MSIGLTWKRAQGASRQVKLPVQSPTVCVATLFHRRLFVLRLATLIPLLSKSDFVREGSVRTLPDVRYYALNPIFFSSSKGSYLEWTILLFLFYLFYSIIFNASLMLLLIILSSTKAVATAAELRDFLDYRSQETVCTACNDYQLLFSLLCLLGLRIEPVSLPFLFS